MDTTLPVTIRPAYADDATALHRLAALDSAFVPPARLLVAEVEGELWAALDPDGGTVIADPFRPTAALVALLRLRATPRAVTLRRHGWRLRRARAA